MAVIIIFGLFIYVPTCIPILAIKRKRCPVQNHEQLTLTMPVILTKQSFFLEFQRSKLFFFNHHIKHIFYSSKTNFFLWEKYRKQISFFENSSAPSNGCSLNYKQKAFCSHSCILWHAYHFELNFIFQWNLWRFPYFLPPEWQRTWAYGIIRHFSWVHFSFQANSVIKIANETDRDRVFQHGPFHMTQTQYKPVQEECAYPSWERWAIGQLCSTFVSVSWYITLISLHIRTGGYWLVTTVHLFTAYPGQFHISSESPATDFLRLLHCIWQDIFCRPV